MERTEGPAAAPLRASVRSRLEGDRLRHVESVAETVLAIAADAGWSLSDRDAVERAAWYHDARKPDGPDAWRKAILDAGEEPDPWAAAYAPELLHAQAAAVWARRRGETDPRVLAAVRHHPTAHPAWGRIGKLLYVADFAEPTRSFSEVVDAASLRKRAAEGEAGLHRSARTVLGLRLRWVLDRGRPVHPDGWRAWNAWTETS
ncbi:MAG: HD domain-containing protein [Gemmatimonadota bacterium]|nr:HD domain-containing protein [Gemmatimonadota bacterium]